MLELPCSFVRCFVRSFLFVVRYWQAKLGFHCISVPIKFSCFSFLFSSLLFSLWNIHIIRLNHRGACSSYSSAIFSLYSICSFLVELEHKLVQKGQRERTNWDVVILQALSFSHSIQFFASTQVGFSLFLCLSRWIRAILWCNLRICCFSRRPIGLKATLEIPKKSAFILKQTCPCVLCVCVCFCVRIHILIRPIPIPIPISIPIIQWAQFCARSGLHLSGF